MSKYLIKLKPHDKFFFGTGKEFGPDNQNYFVESGLFPQQTTLLGMLRYQLLCQAPETIFKDNKIRDKDKAEKLIGKSSFNMGEKNITFGKIKSLSPVFLMHNTHKYFPLNREYRYKDKKLDSLELQKIGDHFLLEGYDPKQELQDFWRNRDVTRTLSLDDIFKPQTQVGIKKNYGGSTEDNAFYQQTFQKFADAHWCFAFYAEVEPNLSSSPAVVLGGERQTFSMEVVEAGNSDTNEYPLTYFASKDFYKVVLTSDAYISGDVDEFCDFAMTTLKNFRCLQAKTASTDRYYNIKQTNNQDDTYKTKNLYKSQSVELYSRGSVFYFTEQENLKNFANKLEFESSEFYTIGYNHFKIIKKQDS